MSRGTLAILVVLLALLASTAVPAGGLASPAQAAKKTTSCKKRAAARKKGRARASKAAKRCKQAKRKQPVTKKPKVPAATTPAAPSPSSEQLPGTGTTVTARILPGSATTLDLGRGIVRTFQLSGTFGGYLEGEYQPGTDAAMTLTHGALAVAPTDVLTDACPAPAISRTNPATSVMLDPNRPSPLLIGADGAVKLTAHIVIRVVLDLRGASDCGGPTTTSGFADTPGTVVIAGRLGAPGIASFELGSRLFPLPLRECWSPGTPTTACLTPPTPLMTTGETKLSVAVTLGS